jgi:ferredoxin-thioredoxin reductase catalytic subunit
MAGHAKFVRQLAEAYAAARGFRLSDKADKVLELIVIRDGACPCRAVAVPCPCPYHLEEIEKDGQCHCGLFRK